MYKLLNWVRNYGSESYNIHIENNENINNENNINSVNKDITSSDEDSFSDLDEQIIISNLDRLSNTKNYLLKIYNQKNKPTSKEIKDEILDKYYKETDLFYDITVCKKILNGKNCRIILYFYYDLRSHLDELYELCNCCKNKKDINIIIDTYCEAIDILEKNFKTSIMNTKEVKEIIEIGNYSRKKKKK